MFLFQRSFRSRSRRATRRGGWIARGLLIVLVLLGGRTILASESLSDLTGPWRLFIDDYNVAARTNTTRTYHAFQKYAANPVLIADRPWEGANIYVYGTVLPNESGPGYRMWYHSLNFSLPKGDQVHAAYATSTDGIHWEKPNLGIVMFNGSTDNNMFIVPGNCPSVMHTPWDAGIGQAYKLMRGGGSGQFSGAWSADGLHWTEDPASVCPPASDVCTFNWDAHGQRYVGFPKLGAVVNGLSRRASAFWATPDFHSWSVPYVVLAPDSWDDRWVPAGTDQRTHFYGLCGFAYESMYVGFLWLFRATGKISGADDGPIYIEIVSSHDGIHWRREEGDRPPILPLGPAGSWDAGMVFTTTHPLVEGDTIRLYYGGFNSTHADQNAWHAAIGLATLRKDGFASLDAAGTVGRVTTKRIAGANGPLHVNCAAAAGGWLKVEVLDEHGTPLAGYGEADCNALQGDLVDQIVTWGTNSELPAAAGPIRLRFVMQNASLYSFMAGADVVMLDEPPSPPLGILCDFEGDSGQVATDKLVSDGVQTPAMQGDVRVSTNADLAAFGERAAGFGFGTASPNLLTIPGTANLGTQFTLAAMVHSATGACARIFSTPRAAWGAPLAPLSLEFDPSGVYVPGLRLTCKGMQVTSAVPGVGGEQYHHIAATYDDGEVMLYLDGVPVAYAHISGGDPVQLPGNLVVGADPTPGADGQFIGYADDVLVLGRVLSAAEVASLAQDGASTFFGVARAACDFDRDGDVDLEDFSIFQGCFNGPNQPPACVTAGQAPASAGGPGRSPSALPAALPIGFLENWDNYALGDADPAYAARWTILPGMRRYQIDSICPSSGTRTARAPKGGMPSGITHDLTPDLAAVVPDPLGVFGSDANPLVLSYAACLRDSVAYADLWIEVAKGDVYAPAADSATILPVLAYGMTAGLHGPNTLAWYFDGQRWRSAAVVNTSLETNLLSMRIVAGNATLSGGGGSVTYPRAYTGGFDRITIRTQYNDVRARFLDDVRLTGGEVIRACTEAPQIASVAPSAARSDEATGVVATGSGFLAGYTQVRLVRSGQPDVVAAMVDVAPDGLSLRCRFDLNLHGAAPGVWDVVVNTPDCPEATLAGGFTVLPPAARVAADLDRDGDVDLADFNAFQACFNGANRTPACQ